MLSKIANCYYEFGDLSLAITNYTLAEYILSKESSNINSDLISRIYYGQAFYHSKLKKYAISISYIEKIINMKNIDSSIILDANMLLGNIYFRTKKTQEAINIYEDLNKIFPNNFNILVNLSTLYDLIGDKVLSNKILYNIDTNNAEDVDFLVVYLLNAKNTLINKSKIKALKYLNKALALSIKYKSIDSIIIIFNNICIDMDKKLIDLYDLRKYLGILYRVKNDNVFNELFGKRLNKILAKLLLNKNINYECKNIISNILGGD